MTQGASLPLILRFSVPILLGNIFQQLYTVVDGIVVGKSISDNALAAVGVSFPITYMLISILMGIGMGTSILISQFYGNKDMVNLHRTIRTGHAMIFKTFLPLTLFGIMTAGFFLNLLQTQAEIFDDAKLYLVIYYTGLLAQFGYVLASGILQAIGNSRTPLLVLISSSILHIILAILFVPVLRWGIAGIALSTVVSQYFSWLLCLWFLNRELPGALSFRKEDDPAESSVKEILRLGLPISIQNVLYSFGMMVMQPLINGYGVIFVAGYNAAIRVDGFVFMPVTSIASAVTTYVGQNTGAGKTERLKEGIRSTITLGMIISLVLAAIVIPLRSPLMSLFSNDPAVIDAGNAYLVRVIPLYFISTLQYLYMGILRGSGISLMPTVAALVSLWAARVPSAYLLSQYFGSDNMHWCYPIGWLMGLAVLIPYYYRGSWKHKQIELNKGKQV